MTSSRTLALATVLLGAGCVFGAESGTSGGTAVAGDSDTSATTSSSATGDVSSDDGIGDGSGDATDGTTGAPGDTTGPSVGDESTGGCEPIPWFPDNDDDGFGDPAGPSVQACDPVDGHAPNADDCDDGSAMVHPGLDEICDGIDNDCDVAVDEWSAANATCNGCLAVPNATSIHYACVAGVSWAAAEGACETKGATLVRIDDQPENDAVEAAAAQQAAGDWWIGLRWDGSAHVWTDGQAATYTNWRPLAPDYSGDCGELDTLDAGLWNDVDCADTATTVGYVCEGPLQ